MKTAGSVTNWLRALEAGSDDAAQLLWERYQSEMHQVAQRRMRRLKRRDVMDEEDIVISAFAAICLAARRGQLASIGNRNELWAMLLVTIHNRIGQREEYAGAAKRNVELTRRPSDSVEEFGSRLERLVSPVPGPEDAALQAEAASELLAKLDDQDLRAVAVLRMTGYTNEEIAAEMGYSRRTIQRMLSLIRSCWEEFDGSQYDSRDESPDRE